MFLKIFCIRVFWPQEALALEGLNYEWAWFASCLSRPCLALWSHNNHYMKWPLLSTVNNHINTFHTSNSVQRSQKTSHGETHQIEHTRKWINETILILQLSDMQSCYEKHKISTIWFNSIEPDRKTFKKNENLGMTKFSFCNELT